MGWEHGRSEKQTQQKENKGSEMNPLSSRSRSHPDIFFFLFIFTLPETCSLSRHHLLDHSWVDLRKDRILLLSEKIHNFTSAKNNCEINLT